MSRFKLRLSDVEMDVFGNCIAYVVKRSGCSTIYELARCESLENVFNRMKRMYRPDKRKYTVRLSAIEASSMLDLMNETMNAKVSGSILAFITPIYQSLDNQVTNELNIYNSRIL